MSLPPIRRAPLFPFLRGCSFFKALKGDGGTLEEVWTGIFLSPELSFTLHFLCSFSSGALGEHFNPHLGPRMNLKARQLPLFSAASLNLPTHPFVYSVGGLQGLCLGHGTMVQFQMGEEVTVIPLSSGLMYPPPKKRKKIPLAST